jgi:6-phosphogluconolactonase
VTTGRTLSFLPRNEGGKEIQFVRNCRRTVFLLFVFVIAASVCRAQAGDFYMYFGTYTGFKFVSHSATIGVGESNSKGIYVSKFHAATGEIGQPELAAEIANPSFLTVSPNHEFLYAVSEDPLSLGPPLDHASYVSAYAIDHTTGKLRLLNTVPTGGTSTCYLSTDKTGKYVLLANFGSGSISIVRVNEDGSLGRQTAFVQHLGHGSPSVPVQSSPHPHTIRVSPDNRYVIVSDLGTDKVYIYHFDEKTGMVSPLDPTTAAVEPGGGPRRFIFDHEGKFGYQLNEMGSTLVTYAWDPAKGSLTQLQELSIAPPRLRNAGAELQISNDGKFLYASNRLSQFNAQDPTKIDRLPGTIAVFAIDPQKHTLTELHQVPSGGIMPRNFAIDPTGQYLIVLNQISNNVVQFKIDAATGMLTNTGREIKVDTPVCLQFVPVV